MRPILFALLLLPLASFSQGGAGRFFYVSPLGNDKNPGTLERPFASPQQARQAIRNAKTLAPEQAFTVYFREGTYQGMATLDLQAADSGSLRFPITYAAYPGENVRLHGGVFLKNKDFKPLSDPVVLRRLVPEARGKVLVLQLKKSGISDFGTLRQHGFGTTPEPAALELFIDGQRQTLARYPNEGILKIGKLYDRGSIPRQGDHSNRGAEFGYE
ncbi:MAG: hypothetical protein IT260_22390, partial [Saprospiraceae bacterium]|nr:hypothetical protein [Saprospiraceae bacterium]